MVFDAGLELFSAMQRVKLGSDPGTEARKFVARAPERIWFHREHAPKRLCVIDAWLSGSTIESIMVSTKLTRRQVMSVIKKYRRDFTYDQPCP